MSHVSGLISLLVETDTTEKPPQGGFSVFFIFELFMPQMICFRGTLLFLVSLYFVVEHNEQRNEVIISGRCRYGYHAYR